jgi:hypothetical protein
VIRPSHPQAAPELGLDDFVQDDPAVREGHTKPRWAVTDPMQVPPIRMPGPRRIAVEASVRDR